FFDFEGDPMWSEPGSPDWGLEYLFGVIEAPVDGADPVFRTFWAHDRAQEKQGLLDFLAYVAERRRRWPDLHIYHYAAYERTALLRLAVRHGVGEADVDNLLRAGVFVDLYAVVRGAIRVSQRSYSLKKLEPLYMGEHHRDDEGVTTAGDSIVVYHEYTQAVIEERSEAATRLIEQIRVYNEYDCLSTLRLRDWLLARAAEAGVQIGGAAPSAEEPEEPNALEAELRAFVPVGTGVARTADQQALAMLAATVQYNRREHKPYWWGHFDRLRNPVDEWVRGADVFHVESGSVVQPWGKEGNQRSLRRLLRLDGRFGGGSAASEGGRLHAVYDRPLPEGMEPLPGHLRAKSGDVSILERGSDQTGAFLVVEETLPKGVAQHDCVPLALTPTPPPMTKSIDEALDELGATVVSTDGALFPQPGLDLLRRLPPRTLSGSLPVVSGHDDDRFADAITAAVLDLDRSYLGVQGPPGTGKTHVAAQVITRLVRDHGWKIGVVAQSHAAVENVLSAVVRAGLDPGLVAKCPKEADCERVWTEIGKDDLAAYTAANAGTGYVIGGTAWDLTNTRRIGRGQLDLVVVDEAGQYSLAPTIACSTAGTRLLLLGDPQQLPQVSQGTHPEPVGGSALGWLLGAESIMPARLGYFLETTWRMHPALTAKVSTLSYAGALRSKEARTTARSLDGIEPGVHVVMVEHRGNTTESIEEARAVTRLVATLIGRPWLDPDENASTSGTAPAPRALTAADIRVVTPYNAQVARIREALESAGHGDVAVASVDKFQGQEAAVIIVSMAASAAADVSRGLGFLLSRNRLNVAISRGKWAAYLVRSQVLTDFSPRSPGELVALGAFIGLCVTELQDDCDFDNGREHLALRRQRAGLPHDPQGHAQRPGARDVRSRHPGRRRPSLDYGSAAGVGDETGACDPDGCPI
ncbi:MAG: TM0106 family RecB-like putative nuclease, partial [Nostocoides sp.]